MSELSKRIKMRREELGLSQDELAKKLGYKSRSTIAKIESGDNDIPQAKIKAFSDALATTPAELMGWEQSPEKANRQLSTEKFFENIEVLYNVKKDAFLNTISRLCKIYRIGRNITEVDLVQRTDISLERYLDFENDHKDIGFDNIKNIILFLKLDIYSIEATLFLAAVSNDYNYDEIIIKSQNLMYNKKENKTMTDEEMLFNVARLNALFGGSIKYEEKTKGHDKKEGI